MHALKRTFSTTYSRAAGVVLALVFVVAVAGTHLAPDDPLHQDTDTLFAHAGSAGHLLGTDYIGRDVLSRLLAGAGPSVLDALAMVAVGLALGALPGVLSAFAGRFGEFLLQRTSDAFMTLPPIVFAIAVAGLFTDGQVAAIIAIGVLLAPRFFRVARAETLGFAHMQYVEAAQLLGASRTWIVRRHIWRKVLPTIAVTTATSAGYAVLASASLGFLGLGVQAPNPTWGGMLSDNVQHLAEDAWAPIWPGLFIAVTVWALNVLADGLRDGLAVRSGLEEAAIVGDAESVVPAPRAPLGALARERVGVHDAV
jgi:peptide/nickel transport system permease protein